MFFNKNVWITPKILLKFVSKGPITDVPTLSTMLTLQKQENFALAAVCLI